MTALSQFDRLESPGLWRANEAAQRRDVIVTFGDASLVISDTQERPLSHWSLAALTRQNPGVRPALYTPGGEATETLEIDDETMISAIETVRNAISRTRPRRGRLRLWLFGGSVAAILALGIFWLPGALVRHTAKVVPPPARIEIGRALLEQLGRIGGAPCRGNGGAQVMGKLAQKLPGTGDVKVMRAGIRDAAHLPGGMVLVNRALVEDYDGAEVVAGFIVAERARAAQADPLVALLRHAGIGATLKLLTTGSLPADALQSYAQTLSTEPPAPLADDVLLAAFAKAGLSSRPYAYALDVSGETTLGLIEADPMRSEAPAPLLGDADWVRLQGICGA